MAKIDTLLRMIAEKGVERVVLTGDKPYQVFVAGQSTAHGAATPQAHLKQLLEEIVPPSLAPGLRDGNAFYFQHSSPFGVFDIGVSSDIGVTRVTITPAKAEKNPAPAPNPPAPTSTVPPPAPSAPAPTAIVPAPAWPQNPPPNSPPPPPAYPAPAYPAPAYPAPAYPPPPVIVMPPAYPPQVHMMPPYDPRMQPSPCSKVLGGLLGIFLAPLGIHRFYLGYTGAGVAYLLLTFVFSWLTCGITAWIAGIWGFIEGIVILTGGMKDAEGRSLS